MDRLASQQYDLPSLRPWLRERSAAERRTLARLWQIAPGAGAEVGDEVLLQAMLAPETLAGVLQRLRPSDRAALERLQAEGGALPVHVLEREFGAIRDHRAYANPRAYLEALSGPPTPTERLFVLGLIQQRHSPAGALYAIPVELLALLPPVPPRDRRLRLAAVTPQQVQAGDPGQLEQALVALLAAAYEAPLPVGHDGTLRQPKAPRARAWLSGIIALGAPIAERGSPYLGFVRQLALELGLLKRTRAGLRPAASALDWLGQPPLERRRRLLEAWLSCPWDELTALCGLRWRARPLRRDLRLPRHNLLRLLGQLGPGQWFAFDDWVAEVRRVEPDFQRPDGLYDTWMLADAAGHSLVGFQHWPEVEGRLARAYLSGPLAWLGLVDLGRLQEQGAQAARLNGWGAALLIGAAAPAVAEERLVVQANFTVFAPPQLPPLPRFQLSRVSEREAHGSYDVYHLTRAALLRALDRGGEVEEILAFLERWSDEPLPQNVTFSLRQWAASRQELRMRPMLLLQARDPLRLEQLRRDRRVALPPFEALDGQRWALELADAGALAQALRQAGYGVEAELPAQQDPLDERDLAVLLSCAEVVARLAEARGLAGGPALALRRRLERRLPSTLRATARREAGALADRLLASISEDERENEKERRS